MTRPLTLVSAPAGFGKTTLLSQWIEERKPTAAWISLDEADNELGCFLSYLIGGLQRIHANVGQTTLPLLQLPQLPPLQSLLTPLLNEIAAIPDHFIFVFDDFHRVEASAIHSALDFLLDHLAPQMHLIISTRSEPLLPLPRLRARGMLSEIRADDLRFTADEANAFLSGTMTLNLSAEQITALEARTEGWIVGLQMAALSMREQKDLAAFITGFTGSHRYILDYLLEEVLRQQTQSVQAFLLQTCILDRLTGPLCDAVTDQKNGEQTLEALERANLFLVPLDDERRWYRYHHLFADVLRNRLQHTFTQQIPELHRRASEWYEQNGLTPEAVNHALAARNWDRAASLVERHGLTLTVRGQSPLVLRWLNALPETLLLTHPRLSLLHASVLTFANQLDEARLRIQEAERAVALDGSSHSKALHGWAAVVRGALSLASGDLAQGVAHSREALELLPEENAIERASAAGQASRAYQTSGDVTLATEQLVARLAAEAETSGSLIGIASCLTNLGRLYILQGRLREAVATFARLARAMPGPAVLPNLFHGAGYYFGMADVLLEWNQQNAAEQQLAQGLELVKGSLLVYADVVILGYLTLARLRRATGDDQGALSALDEFERLAEQRRYASIFVEKGAAARAREWLWQGRVDLAARWAEASGLSADDSELLYPSQDAYLTLARVLIARRNTRQLLQLLNRLSQSAEAGGRIGDVIEILILTGLALQLQGNTAEALFAVQRALSLAQPEGYVRIFADEGEPMRMLLAECDQNESTWDRWPHRREGAHFRPYIQKLLSAFRVRNSPLQSGKHNPAQTRQEAAQSALPAEPLTERELQVLRLVAAGLSNQEIAGKLVIALGTVKTHINNIFGKLGVATRTQAVARAQELGLLS